MLMQFIVVDGDKANYIYSGYECMFECDVEDVEVASDELSEILDLVTEEDLAGLQDAKDYDVPALLDCLKELGFIDHWEALQVEVEE